ncbi:DUF2795 domain-containing protein [Patescibacteria group bacterium]|nr:DUF2795 domain-containing protein [Patescibacteria group bacterium]
MDDGNDNWDDEGVVNAAQVQKFLSGVNYPASKQDLINKAREEGADENVIQTLEKLPDQMFDTLADVSQAIGKIE